MKKSRPTSPTRRILFTFKPMCAFFLFLYMKDVRYVQHNPTISHPMNMNRKLSAITTNMYPAIKSCMMNQNLVRLGSSRIYPAEKLATAKPIMLTTDAIRTLNGSTSTPNLDWRRKNVQVIYLTSKGPRHHRKRENYTQPNGGYSQVISEPPQSLEEAEDGGEYSPNCWKHPAEPWCVWKQHIYIKPS